MSAIEWLKANRKLISFLGGAVGIASVIAHQWFFGTVGFGIAWLFLIVT